MVLTVVVLAAVLLFAARRRAKHRRDCLGAASHARRTRSMLAVIALVGVQLFMLAPDAMAAECTEPPIPERPGAGMVGAIDPPTGSKGNSAADTNYSKYGYAGTVWNVYDDNCVLSKNITDPDATIDTWAGNQMFNIGKNLVGATNGLHYAMLSRPGMLTPLDDAVKRAANTFYDNVYVKWFGLAALILAVLLFRQIWHGDLARIGHRGMWALGGMWLAASVVAIGPVYVQLDALLLDETAQIQAGFVSKEQPHQNDALPELLYTNVIYKNWLRGEFGDPNAENAKKYGPELLSYQAWTKDDVNSANDQAKIEQKQNGYRSMLGKLGSSAGFFKGTDGSRIGAGFLAMLQGFAYSLFPLLAKAAVLLAQVLLRVLLLGAPLIGLAAMVAPTLLPKVARVAGAVLLSVLMLSAMAGMHVLMLNLIFTTGTQLSLLAQMLLAGLLTVIFLMIGRPIRRMKQMVELSVGSIGTGTTSAGGGGIFSKFRRRGSSADENTPQDKFWTSVRGQDTEALPTENADNERRRTRPEASFMSATAQRLDRRNAQTAGQAASGVAGVPSSATRALPPSRKTGYSGPTTAVPEAGHSRTVDTPAVVEGRWERDEEPVMVPSTVVHPDGSRRRDEERPLPRTVRRAETEMVGGRPVFVLYRPSGGFEVRDNEIFDNEQPRSERSPAR
jgi:hypothetical protein